MNFTHSLRAEQRISAARTEFVTTLTNTVKQKVLTDEDADRLVKETEAQFALKRARIDLIRTASLLKTAGGNETGLSGREELQRRNQQLQDSQRVINRGEELRRGKLGTQPEPTLMLASTSVPGANGTPATYTRPCSSTVAEVSKVLMALVGCKQHVCFSGLAKPIDFHGYCSFDTGCKQ